MKDFLVEIRDFFVSLKLTVVLIAFSMLLVFAATLDQVNLGIWAVQEKYFRSFIVYTQAGPATVPIFPGGYVIGSLLLINLVAAHVYRFTFSWRKVGVLLTHFGLILLLIGELLSGLWQEDSHLRLNEGETKNYIESYRHNELVFVDTTDAAFDDVVGIPEELLARKTPIQHPKLPFRVVPKTYYPNSVLQARPANGPAAQATAGFGERILAAPQPITYRPNEVNMPTALFELIGPAGSLGTYLASPQIVMPQEFTHDGRKWKLTFRTKREYQPFALTLVKFSHDRYPGTEIPKNFSSRVKIKSPDGRDDREALIFMNNPLRYAGLTFYQSGFENNDRTTILQVVRNPSWLLPYIACGLMTVGLLAQFGIHLAGFVGQRRRTRPTTAPRTQTQ
jgi:hypothetical protein